MSDTSKGPSKPIVPPIVLSSTFEFPTAESMIDAAVRPCTDHLYTRWSNPTLAQVEQRVAELEGAEQALLTASGMSAIHVALMAALDVGSGRTANGGQTGSGAEGETGVLLVQRETYGATHELVEHVLSPLGIEVRRANVDAMADAAGSLPPRSVIYVELPTNPLIRLVDVSAVRRQAPEDACIIVDATFATPINVRVLDLGADLSVHSATKYLGGHHDLIAGVVSGNGPLIARAWRMRKLFGPVLDPAAAYRLWRGLETLALRVERQNASAADLARRLSNHPRVERVHHPTLEAHPDHALSRRMMRGCGGVLSFEVAGGAPGAAAVANATGHIARAASLGGVSTLVTWPSGVTHVGLSPDERAASGVGPGLLRLAVGIEPVETLWEDLAQALEEAP
ncbi:MAG: aminotransferase class I/II-fold pyridoxal phosphate-dependent enzyme [Myxococcota bacterium]|nr:aminotransferase class I/II-fold pyridoxal phosphate-dependent enzyme [Myxococcota bacterium]